MSAPQRGAAPVGQVAALPRLEMAAVLLLRLRSDGLGACAEIAKEAERALGGAAGRGWLAAFDAMLELLARHGRRPLMRHALGCRCLGADESAVATLITAAADGEREEALLIAMLLVRADIAPALAETAQTVGLGLKRMASRLPLPANATCNPERATRH